jgi:glycine betaine catabolism B
MFEPIDKLLNGFTMYKVMLYSLRLLIGVAAAAALFGWIGYEWWQILLSPIILVSACYVANIGLAKLLKVPHNVESYIITANILVFVLPPPTTVMRGVLLALAGITAIASKYVLVMHGRHLFNPAAVGAFVISISGLLGATWWVATPAMAIPVAIVALILLRKQRAFTLFFSFVAAATGLMLITNSLIGGQAPLDVVSNLILSWPLLFMGSVMLTEPGTLPPVRYGQVWYGVIVGLLFTSQLSWGSLGTTPQLSLLVGNLLAALAFPALGVMLRLKQTVQVSPTSYELVFEQPAERLQFTSGQYMEWTLQHPKWDFRGNRRTFSLASAPTESDVRIGVKKYNPSSTFKRALLDLQPGDTIRAAHIAGSFTLPSDPQTPLLLVAGGIGITPIRSMVKYLTDTNQQRNCVVLYLASADNEFVFKDILDAGNAVGVQVQYVTGSLDANGFKQAVPDIAERTVYLSGPDGMVTNFRKTMRKLGVPALHIHTDHFTGY